MNNFNKLFFESKNPLATIWNSIPVSIKYNMNNKDYITITCNEDTTLNDFIKYIKNYKKDYGKRKIKHFKINYQYSNDSIVFDSDISHIVLYNSNIKTAKEIYKLLDIKNRQLEDIDNFRLTTKEKNYLIKQYDATINNMIEDIKKLEIAKIALICGKRQNFLKNSKNKKN